MNRFTIKRIFLLVLGLTYMGLGIYIFIRKILPSPWGEILGALFILYGAWRSYRAVARQVETNT